jgi:hypothetical protein
MSEPCFAVGVLARFLTLDVLFATRFSLLSIRPAEELSTVDPGESCQDSLSSRDLQTKSWATEADRYTVFFFARSFLNIFVKKYTTAVRIHANVTVIIIMAGVSIAVLSIAIWKSEITCTMRPTAHETTTLIKT